MSNDNSMQVDAKKSTLNKPIVGKWGSVMFGMEVALFLTLGIYFVMNGFHWFENFALMMSGWTVFAAICGLFAYHLNELARKSRLRSISKVKLAVMALGVIITIVLIMIEHSSAGLTQVTLGVFVVLPFILLMSVITLIFMIIAFARATKSRAKYSRISIWLFSVILSISAVTVAVLLPMLNRALFDSRVDALKGMVQKAFDDYSECSAKKGIAEGYANDDKHYRYLDSAYMKIGVCDENSALAIRASTVATNFSDASVQTSILKYNYDFTHGLDRGNFFSHIAKYDKYSRRKRAILVFTDDIDGFIANRGREFSSTTNDDVYFASAKNIGRADEYKAMLFALKFDENTNALGAPYEQPPGRILIKVMNEAGLNLNEQHYDCDVVSKCRLTTF